MQNLHERSDAGYSGSGLADGVEEVVEHGEEEEPDEPSGRKEKKALGAAPVVDEGEDEGDGRSEAEEEPGRIVAYSDEEGARQGQSRDRQQDSGHLQPGGRLGKFFQPFHLSFLHPISIDR